MVICQYCGKENNQPDALYCSSCGSSLRQSRSMGQASVVPQSQPPPMSGPTPPGTYGYGSSFGTSERYEKALAGVERMATVVALLAVVTLLLTLY